MLTPLHFWLVFFGTGLLFVFLAYWGGRWRRLNPKEVAQGDGPAGCAHCGYDVRGLPSHVCPECGSDLNEVGRLAPRYRKWQKVPPVLRAVVYTAAVAISAAMLILLSVGGTFRIGPFGSMLPVHVPTTQTTVDHFDPFHPTLVDATGEPLRVTAAREQVIRYHPFTEESEERWSEVSHKSIARIYFGISPRNWPADHLRFEVDLLAGTWRAVDGRSGEVISSGEGVPGVEAVHRLANDFAQKRAANFEMKQKMTMGQGGPVPLNSVPAGSVTYEWTDTGTVSLAQAAQLSMHMDVPRQEPRADVRAIFEREDLSGGSTWRLGSGGYGQAEELDWYTWLWLIGFWLLVLSAGLWFVTRRREIRPKGDAAFEPARIPSHAGET